MNTTNYFINPQTKLLRSGWRALIFMIVLTLPQLLMFKSGQTANKQTDSVFEISLSMIFVYVILIGWVVLISWASLRFLDRLNLRSLGFSFHSNWRREIVQGFAVSALMIATIVLLQMLSGGTGLKPNPVWWNGGLQIAGLTLVAKDALIALALLVLAGAFEELVYRGYAFQTLLRGMSPIVPILFLSVYFGLGHWANPNRTFFSTANTVLAGVWLSVAYLKTRSLWFPTALHFGWNWVMGALFGLPVSGLLIPQHPILLSSIAEPLWMTGGSYGPEGGVAATIVLLISTIAIWKAKWIRISTEQQIASASAMVKDEPAIGLNLRNEES